LEEY
jgi:hypothetical protein